MATLAEIGLQAPRVRDEDDIASNNQRSEVIMIHPGRINTGSTSERAWHWSATRMGDLLDLGAPAMESDSVPSPSTPPIEGAFA